MSPRRLVILGSTGSIGVNALDVLRRLPHWRKSHRVWGLSGHRNLELLKSQIAEFRPARVAVADASAAQEIKTWARRRRLTLEVEHGLSALVRLAEAPEADWVLSAVVGAVGLEPLFAALSRGKTVALANKEALIVAGELLTSTARRRGGTLIPVDSEHSALFQCLAGATPKDVKRLVLTASGGAFYRRADTLDGVSVAEALAHPTWKMGRKITVDSATLTNKGLEAIEAHHLFGVPLKDVHIVIHPQSIVHSLVEFVDGAQLAQLSHPDMRLPIQYALTYPRRMKTSLRPLRLEEVGRLDFAPPDFSRFPCLGLALEAGEKGGLHPAVFNGANEEAVRAFLEEKISFTGIARVLAGVMSGFGRDSLARGRAASLTAIARADRWGREKAKEIMEEEPCRT
jgi:1-deoxy-D-xylulose-5-phosphate reductoisomerase